MSTKQTIKTRITDTASCVGCEHYQPPGIFELCKHERSAYTYDGREDFHTVQHMREEHAPCGLTGKLRVEVLV